MSYKITSRCIGCSACAKKCPEEAITGELKSQFQIDEFLCSECGNCFRTCPAGAIQDPAGNLSPAKKPGQEPKASIAADICAGCKSCYLNCPHDAISMTKKGLLSAPHGKVTRTQCIGCGTCLEFCITGAIKVSTK